MKDHDKERIVAEIVDMEVDSFVRVPTGEEPSCRAHLDDMKMHRTVQFAPWSTDTCRSYLDDLVAAKEAGINLMVQKYARMDDLIPPLSTDPAIDTIVERYAEWQREIIERYPRVMDGARDIDDFTRYLRGELETYSDKTRALLLRDARSYVERGENMSIVVYEAMAVRAGYEGLDAMEAGYSQRGR